MLEASYAEALDPAEPKPTNWPKMVLATVLGLGLLAGAAFAGCWYGTESAKVRTQTQPSPTSQFDCHTLEDFEMKDLGQVPEIVCRECEGKWEVLSMDIDATGCNPKTSDAGKSCTSYDQCVGQCLAERDASTVGICSEYKYRLGCALELSEGKPVMICRD